MLPPDLPGFLDLFLCRYAVPLEVVHVEPGAEVFSGKPKVPELQHGLSVAQRPAEIGDDLGFFFVLFVHVLEVVEHLCVLRRAAPRPAVGHRARQEVSGEVVPVPGQLAQERLLPGGGTGAVDVYQVTVHVAGYFVTERARDGRRVPLSIPVMIVYRAEEKQYPANEGNSFRVNRVAGARCYIQECYVRETALTEKE